MESSLVSILIITFNSSKYILETLESAKNQRYKNIELIISDDCSTDDTVIICKSWLEKNAGRFVRTKILTVPQNTGICSNLNRGFRECNGQWIKFIAGDDIMLDNCISDNIQYVMSNNGTEIALSKMIHFKDSFTKSNILDYEITNNKILSFFQKDFSNQLKTIVSINYLPAPTVFVKKGLLDRYGLFIEKYFYEDWPMWITLIENRVKIQYFETATVAYRHNANSLTASTTTLFNMRHIDARIMIMRDMCYKYYSKWRIYVEELNYKLAKYFYNHGMNVSSGVNKFLWHTTQKILLILKGDM